MADALFETERLVLRREIPGDRAVWLEHMNSPEVMAHLGGPAQPEQVARSFERMALAELPFLLVARKADGLLVGKCGLSRIETPHAPGALQGRLQIGWTIRADCWGKGYAREAAGAMIDHAFAGLGADALFGQTSQANLRSWRLMEHLGMIRRPDLEYDDPDYSAAENPTIVFALARPVRAGQ